MWKPVARRDAPLEGEALVAHNLKTMRKARRLSQEDIAERMTGLGFKMHQTQVAKIENGTRPISFDEVLGFAKALGVPPNEFMSVEVYGPDTIEYELQQARLALDAAEIEWRSTQAVEEAARVRYEEARAAYTLAQDRLAKDRHDTAPIVRRGPGIR